MLRRGQYTSGPSENQEIRKILTILKSCKMMKKLGFQDCVVTPTQASFEPEVFGNKLLRVNIDAEH